MWAIRTLETELARRDELAEERTKALGLDQPDLGESLWLEGYEGFLIQIKAATCCQKRICEKLESSPMVTPPRMIRGGQNKASPRRGSRSRCIPRLRRTCFWTLLVTAQRKRCRQLSKRVNAPVETAPSLSGDKARGQNPISVSVAKFHTPEHVSSICSYFDPLPLPQTPPAEAVAVAESLINVCGNCAHHSHRQEPAGFCSKFGCKMPPSNPLTRVFISQQASLRAG